jgi:hypothetical protein
MPRKIVFVLVLSILLSACAPAPIRTSEVSLTFTPVPPPALTPTATSAPTATPVPTETVFVSEFDLKIKPERTETVHYKFPESGVEIDVKLITDDSLDPVIRKVTVGEKAYAEFMTRSIYGVWETTHKGQTYESFMKMVAEVQSGIRNPLDIAIPVYANDMQDGIPYQNPDKSVNPAAQKKYLIIPWYKGDKAPKEVDGVEVRAVSEINIALVNGKKVKNITLFKENAYGDAIGMNLDENNLFFYHTPLWINNIENRVNNIAATLTELKGWMMSNTGGPFTGYPHFADQKLWKILLNGGITVE